MKEHLEEQLSGYVDGELSDAERSRVQRHLDGCAACREELSALQEFRQSVTSVNLTQPMDSIPEFFWSQLRRRIESESREARPAKSFLERPFSMVFGTRLALAMAAVVVIVGLGFGFLQLVKSPGIPQAFVKIDRATTDVPNGTVKVAQSQVPGVPVISLPESYVEVERVSTNAPNTTVQPFLSRETGITVIWISGVGNGGSGDSTE